MTAITSASAVNATKDANGAAFFTRIASAISAFSLWVEALRDLSSPGRPSARSLRMIGLDEGAIAKVAKVKFTRA